MKSYANKISVIPVSDIQSISGTTITPKSEKSVDTYYTINDLYPGESPGQVQGNQVYNQSLTAAIDSTSVHLSWKYNGREVVVKLSDTDGNEHLMGSLQVPALSNVVQELNHTTISFKCQALEPIL